MAILFCDDSYRTEKIFSLLRDNMPGVDLRCFPETGNTAEIEYAIILRPAPGSLQNLPNLKAVFTIGAGVDGIIHDATLPDVPVIRNTDPHLSRGIRDYVVYHVLRYQRFFDRYEKQQREHLWKQYPQLPQSDTTVGIMGVGAMGGPAATALRDFGFTVQSWSRTPKHIDGIRSFHGRDQLHEFLAGTQTLVLTLPLTDATRDILDADAFASLPKGACVINLGRGAHLVEDDLVAALDSDHLRAATLDVFAMEPLPDNSPLWSHPKITVTPHIASLTNYATLAKNITRTIHEMEHGRPPGAVVDRSKQY